MFNFQKLTKNQIKEIEEITCLQRCYGDDDNFVNHGMDNLEGEENNGYEDFRINGSGPRQEFEIEEGMGKVKIEGIGMIADVLNQEEIKIILSSEAGYLTGNVDDPSPVLKKENNATN